MREAADNGKLGLLEPVWRAADKALAVAQNRLELFRVEAQEEKVRLFEMVLLASTIMVLGALALALATFALVSLALKGDAFFVIPCLAAAYAIGAAWAWRGLRVRMKATPPFESSAEELKKDRQFFQTPID